MNKEEYLNQLKKYLKRLPADDYQNAMGYFTEYFEDVGPEGEAEAIRELGTPKEAASELLSALLDEKVQAQASSLLVNEPSRQDSYNQGPYSQTPNGGANHQNSSQRYSYKGKGTPHKKNSNSTLSIVLIAILAVLAAPLGAPLGICALVFLLCGVLLLACTILCIFLFSFAAVFAGAILVGTSFSVIASSLPGFCVMIGFGLLGIGFGILFFVAAIFICRWIGLGIVRFSQWIIQKGKVKRHE